jgi:hypothetical protein
MAVSWSSATMRFVTVRSPMIRRKYSGITTRTQARHNQAEPGYVSMRASIARGWHG